MKEASHFHSTALMRIRSASGGNQFAVVQRTFIAQLWRVVMRVTQNITHTQRQLLQQSWGNEIVRFTGDGQLSRQRYPETADTHGQMQLPAVPPTVITTLAPGGFRINRRMRHNACQTMLLVPDATIGAQGGTIDGGGGPLYRPGLQAFNQQTAKAANQRRQSCGQPFKASVPRAARRKAAVFSQQEADLLGQRIRLREEIEQRVSRIEAANNHDDQGFDKQLVGVSFLPPALALLWRRGRRKVLDKRK